MSVLTRKLWHSTRFVAATRRQGSCPAIHKLHRAVGKTGLFLTKVRNQRWTTRALLAGEPQRRPAPAFGSGEPQFFLGKISAGHPQQTLAPGALGSPHHH